MENKTIKRCLNCLRVIRSDQDYCSDRCDVEYSRFVFWRDNVKRFCTDLLVDHSDRKGKENVIVAIRCGKSKRGLTYCRMGNCPIKWDMDKVFKDD